MRLTKGMYGTEFNHNHASDLFGLRCGQMRGSCLAHNSGWYNSAGDKLGWGDLSPTDFAVIKSGLDGDIGEIFVILSETDSFWNFVTSHGAIGSMCGTNPDVEAPGVEYIVTHARFVLTHTDIFYIDHHGHDTIGEFRTLHESLAPARIMSEEGLRTIIQISNKAQGVAQ